MCKFKVALVQFYARVSQIEKNLYTISKLTEYASLKGAKIVCFPELCICGYILDNAEEFSEKIPGYITKRLLQISFENKIIIIVGICEKEQDNKYITQLVIYPNGSYEKYRKTHLGRYEKAIYSAGNTLPVFKYSYNSRYGKQIIKFGIGICYDMHFPQIVTHYSLQGCHIVFAPHASPIGGKKRLKLWDKYLSARAYDNRVYIGACNLISNNKEDGGGIGVWDFRGNLIKKNIKSKEEVVFFDIDLMYLNKIRNGNKKSMKDTFFIKDRRKDLYEKYL